jgi:DNA-binding MarR family transcriptional regulator
MSDPTREIVGLLEEIRDLLIPISASFEEQYDEVQKQRRETKRRQLESLLTDARRPVYPLLFDVRRLSQDAIAREANTTQPTVSRFISALLEAELIGERQDQTGATVYEDTYRLMEFLEEDDARQ